MRSESDLQKAPLFQKLLVILDLQQSNIVIMPRAAWRCAANDSVMSRMTCPAMSVKQVAWQKREQGRLCDDNESYQTYLTSHLTDNMLDNRTSSLAIFNILISRFWRYVAIKQHVPHCLHCIRIIRYLSFTLWVSAYNYLNGRYFVVREINCHQSRKKTHITLHYSGRGMPDSVLRMNLSR